MTSLQARGLVAIALVSAPLLILTTTMLFFTTSYQVNLRMDSRLRDEVNLLHSALARDLHGDPQWLAAVETLLPLNALNRKQGFAIWIGTTLQHSGGVLAVPAPSGQGYLTVRVDGVRIRTYTEDRTIDGDLGQQVVRVSIAEHMDTLRFVVSTILVDLVTPLAVTLPLFGVAMYFALARSLKPVTLLAQQVRSRSAERLDAIAVEGLPIEIAPFAESVNQLMLRISESLEREKRFTADAAHELRTPLTALQTQAQIALDTADDEQRRTALRQIVSNVRRTSRLIQQLLTLARLDPQVPRSDTELVDVRAVAELVASELTASAEARGQRVQVSGASDVYVQGSAEVLSVLLRNLIENALQYSEFGEPVEVRVYAEHQGVLIEVADHGPGIPDCDKKAVFQRFWRIPGTRSVGTGLGLSIVQRAVELHAGSIVLLNRETGSGLRVRVEIPQHA